MGGMVASWFVYLPPDRAAQLYKGLYGEALPWGPTPYLLYTILTERYSFRIPLIEKKLPLLHTL